MFRAYLGLSSEGTTACIHQFVLTLFLDGCLLSRLDWIPICIHVPQNVCCWLKESSNRHHAMFPDGPINRNVAGTGLDYSTQCVYWIYTFDTMYISSCGPGSSVDIAADYGMDGPGSNPGRDKIFRPSRPSLGSNQPPVKWVPVLSRG